MPAFYLPDNPYVEVFNFRLRFDLAAGLIWIDLSPAVWTDPTGVISITLTGTTPRNKFDAGIIWTATNLADSYSMPIPKIQGMYIWGAYTFTLSLRIEDDMNVYPVTKQFSICAPNPDNPVSPDLLGTIQLEVDCITGTMTGRGFCGYPYKGELPINEMVSVTRYYPPEAEIPPQKNISYVPFTVDAYVGLNSVKAVSTLTYEYDDLVYVTLRAVAEAKRNIRCGADFETIYCALDNMYAEAKACGDDPIVYNEKFAKISTLLWLASVGLQQGKDVEDKITDLEELLGVQCTCLACNGERVGPAFLPVCPQVTNAQATLSNDTTLVVSFNSASITQGSTLRIEYRPYCGDQTNGGFTQTAPDTPLTGGNQTVSIGVPKRQVYQVGLTTILPDGTECSTFYIDTGNWADCPPINGDGGGTGGGGGGGSFVTIQPTDFLTLTASDPYLDAGRTTYTNPNWKGRSIESIEQVYYGTKFAGTDFTWITDTDNDVIGFKLPVGKTFAVNEKWVIRYYINVLN